MTLSRHVSIAPSVVCRVMPCSSSLISQTFNQVDPDELIRALRDQSHDSLKTNIHTENAVASTTPYSTRYSSREPIPKFRIPTEGTPAEVTAQLLRDELDLDGRPNLNLARYVAD